MGGWISFDGEFCGYIIVLVFVVCNIISICFFHDKMLFVVVCSGYLTSAEFCYNMAHRRRGKLVVISNRYFLAASPMYKWPRHGTECDVENLRLTFNLLGFDCEVHEDKSSAEMLNIFLNGKQC